MFKSSVLCIPYYILQLNVNEILVFSVSTIVKNNTIFTVLSCYVSQFCEVKFHTFISLHSHDCSICIRVYHALNIVRKKYVLVLSHITSTLK